MEPAQQVAFTSLPSEIHYYLSQYLPTLDRQVLSQTSKLLRTIYNSTSWWCIFIVDESLIPALPPQISSSCYSDAQSKVPYWARPIPLRAFVNPEKFSWFANNYVRMVLNSESCVNRKAIMAQLKTLEINVRQNLANDNSTQNIPQIQEHFSFFRSPYSDKDRIGVTDFSWVPEKYPAISSFQYRHIPFYQDSMAASTPQIWSSSETDGSTLSSVPGQELDLLVPSFLTAMPDSKESCGNNKVFFPIRWLSRHHDMDLDLESKNFNNIMKIRQTSKNDNSNYAFIDIKCFPKHKFTLFNSTVCPELIRSLDITWEQGTRLVEFVLPHLPNLERFIFEPPETFPHQLYVYLLIELGKLQKLRYVELSYYITRLPSTVVSSLRHLNPDMDYCGLVLMCRKLRQSNTGASELMVPQVTHLTVTDLRCTKDLSSIALFPNLKNLAIIRASTVHSLPIQYMLLETVTRLHIYSKTITDTIHIAYGLRSFKNLRILTFIPTTLNIGFYSPANPNPVEELDVLKFHEAIEKAKIGPKDSIAEINEKLTSNINSQRHSSLRHKYSISLEILISMIASPLSNITCCNSHSIVHLYSIWELLFHRILNDLPDLEYLSVSEYYVVKKCVNFKWLLQSHQKLKQIMFASEKSINSGTTEDLFGSKLTPYVKSFEDKRHVLNMELLRNELHQFSTISEKDKASESLDDFSVNEIEIDPNLQAQKSIMAPIAISSLMSFYRGLDKSRYSDDGCVTHDRGSCDSAFRCYKAAGKYHPRGIEYCSMHREKDHDTDKLYKEKDINGWIV